MPKKTRSRGKKKKKPSKSTNKYSKYDTKSGTLEKKGRVCPKCGPGVFMGEHKDRYTCGKCGYMEKKK